MSMPQFTFKVTDGRLFIYTLIQRKVQAIMLADLEGIRKEREHDKDSVPRPQVT